MIEFPGLQDQRFYKYIMTIHAGYTSKTSFDYYFYFITKKPRLKRLLWKNSKIIIYSCSNTKQNV